METKKTNELTQTDSKQAIPSPEDRVRAEMVEKAREAFKCDMCAGSGQVIFYERHFGPCQTCHGAGYDEEASVKAADFALSQIEELQRKVVCSFCGTVTEYDHSKESAQLDAILAHINVCEQSPVRQLIDALSLVEELKGQVAAKEPTPEQIKAIKVGIIKKWQSWIGPLGNPDHYKIQAKMLELEVARETAEAEVALLRKRKDYHAEYVEAVEAAEKARLELDWVLMENESPKETGWYWTFPRNDDDPLTGTSLPYALRYYMANEHGNNFMNNKPMRGWCAKGPITHWLKIPIPPAALTPEPASQAAKEKP